MALAGCTAEPTAGGGSAAVRVATVLGASAAASVTTVVLTVWNVGTPGDPPVAEASLSRLSDAVWSASLDGLPVPARYTFSLDALDGAGTRLYSGAVTADLAASGNTQLSIVAQEMGRPDLVTSTPVITATSISAMPIGAGGSVTVNVAVQNPAQGAPSFSWQDGCGGRFLDPTAASTVWIAPDVAPAAPCPLSVSVAAGGSSTTVFLPVLFQ
jgi:hypothetical protein